MTYVFNDLMTQSFPIPQSEMVLFPGIDNLKDFI